MVLHLIWHKKEKCFYETRTQAPKNKIEKMSVMAIFIVYVQFLGVNYQYDHHGHPLKNGLQSIVDCNNSGNLIQYKTYIAV